MITLESKKDTVKLQGIYGHLAGTKVKNLKIGNVIIWNFGYKSEVMQILPSKTQKNIYSNVKKP